MKAVATGKIKKITSWLSFQKCVLNWLSSFFQEVFEKLIRLPLRFQFPNALFSSYPISRRVNMVTEEAHSLFKSLYPKVAHIDFGRISLVRTSNIAKPK